MKKFGLFILLLSSIIIVHVQIRKKKHKIANIYKR